MWWSWVAIAGGALLWLAFALALSRWGRKERTALQRQYLVLGAFVARGPWAKLTVSDLERMTGMRVDQVYVTLEQLERRRFVQGEWVETEVIGRRRRTYALIAGFFPDGSEWRYPTETLY